VPQQGNRNKTNKQTNKQDIDQIIGPVSSAITPWANNGPLQSLISSISSQLRKLATDSHKGAKILLATHGNQSLTWNRGTLASLISNCTDLDESRLYHQQMLRSHARELGKQNEHLAAQINELADHLDDFARKLQSTE